MTAQRRDCVRDAPAARHAGVGRSRVVAAAFVAILVVLTGCSAIGPLGPGGSGSGAAQPTDGPAAATTDATVTPAEVEVDGDEWNPATDPNPELADPLRYQRAYEALERLDAGLAAEFNAVVLADGRHDATEKDVYAVLPAYGPALRTLVAEHVVATSGVTPVDAGTANVLRYMDASEYHEVDDALLAALADGDWEDPDGDRLITPIERVYGTDPSTPHSDGDQWTDFEEVLALRAIGLPDPHPSEDDIYVEVDSASGAELHDLQRAALTEEAFARAEHPVHWHFLDDASDDDLEPVTDWDAFFPEYRETSFDYFGTGVHYLFVTDAADGIDDRGSTGYGSEYPGILLLSNAAIRADNEWGDLEAMQQYVVHLFGHSFGLSIQTNENIDSFRSTYEDYPSVMVDHRLGRSGTGTRLPGPHALQFHDGEPFDEIAAIRDRRYGAETGLGNQFLSKISVEERANLIWEYPEHAIDDDGDY